MLSKCIPLSTSIRPTKQHKNQHKKQTKKEKRFNHSKSTIKSNKSKTISFGLIGASLLLTINHLLQAYTNDQFSYLVETQYEAQGKQNVSMRSLIPKFAMIQDSLSKVGYRDAENFPQIVVIGIQSSGKSSVMEMIVGEEFIPKGEGTVTKRPLIITLHNNSGKWGEFPDLGKKNIRDFNEIKNIIKRENNKFTSDPLRLDIYSPDVVDLRLVDLPGIIHNPTKDQPEDTRRLIKDICTSYVSNKNTIMLAISQGNTDIQTSEALRFCRKFDPNGDRTLCVLTKLDLVSSKDIPQVMDSIHDLPLSLGYVGVKCRTKNELVDGTSINDALQIEAEYFNSHADWKRYGLHTTCSSLAVELSDMLERKVISVLPEIAEKIRSDIFTKKKELVTFGPPKPKNNTERDEILLSDLRIFVNEYLGASIVYEIKLKIAYQIYNSIFDECNKTLSGLSFRSTVQKTKGSKGDAEFWDGHEDIRFQKWQQKIIQLVDQLNPVCDGIANDAIDTLRKRLDDSLNVLSHRPILQDIVRNTTYKLLNKSYEETTQHISYLVDLERTVNFNSRKLQEKYLVLSGNKPAESEKSSSWFSWKTAETEDIIESGKYSKQWTEAYIEVLSERLAVNIFNALCLEIIDPLKNNLQNAYTVELFQSKLDRDLLFTEKPEIEAKRTFLRNQIVELEKALIDIDSMMKN